MLKYHQMNNQYSRPFYHILCVSFLLILMSQFLLAYASEPICKTLNGSTVKLMGPIDEALLQCAEETITDDIDTIIVSSTGGEVKPGRAIGYLIAKRPRTLVVADICLSSCGNYFVPAAKRLILRDGAFIGLHGTPDPYTFLVHLFDKSDEAEMLKGRSYRDTMEGALKAEEAFAKRFNVAKGWRIYRGLDHSGGFLTSDMSGKLRQTESHKSPSLLIVERPFIESCLPHVEIVKESLNTTVFNDPEILKYITSFKGVGTGSLMCKTETP